MVRILNFFSHLGSYFGPGAVMLIVGIAIIIFAARKLSKMSMAERRRTVAEFNQQFAKDTGSRISDIDAATMRKSIAEDLGIMTRNEQNERRRTTL